MLSKQVDIYDRLGRSLGQVNSLLQKHADLHDRLARAYSKANDQIASQISNITRLGSAFANLSRSTQLVERSIQAQVRAQQAQQRLNNSAHSGGGNSNIVETARGEGSGASGIPHLVQFSGPPLKVEITKSILLPVLTARNAVDALGASKGIGDLGYRTFEHYAKGLSGMSGVHMSPKWMLAHMGAMGNLGPMGPTAQKYMAGTLGGTSSADDAAKKEEKEEKERKNQLIQQLRVMQGVLGALSAGVHNAAAGIEGLGESLFALAKAPSAKMAAAGLVAVGAALGFAYQQSQKQREIVSRGFTGTQSLEMGRQGIRLATIQQALESASQAPTGGSMAFGAASGLGRFGASLADIMPWSAGGNRVNFEATVGPAQARMNLNSFTQMERNPQMQRLRQDVAMMTGERSMNQSSFNAMDQARAGGSAGLRNLMLGGSLAESTDATQRELLINQTARNARRSNESLSDARIRVADALQHELTLLTDSQRELRGANFAREAFQRNLMAGERGRQRLSALSEATDIMPVGQRIRERADIFRELVAAAGPLGRLSQAFMEFTPEAASAVNRANREQLGQDPAAQALVVQQALLEQARQQTDYNRRAADALDSLIAAGVL